MLSANTAGNDRRGASDESDTAGWLRKILNPKREEHNNQDIPKRPNPKPIVCHVCQSTFTNPGDLQRHQTTMSKGKQTKHTQQELLLASCQCYFDGCGFSISSVDDLGSHMNTCKFKPKDRQWNWKDYLNNLPGRNMKAM